jgi:FkbM family methyltransferase
MVSIYLAKKYPFLKIYSFEPVKCNYEKFLKNIELNKIPNGIINIQNKAVTKDVRSVQMFFNQLGHGMSSIIRNYSHNEVLNEVPSITLDNIIKKNNINIIKLLKIDCEVSEDEIIENTKEENLKKILSFRGEFHENKNRFIGNATNLKNYLECYIDDIKVFVAEF